MVALILSLIGCSMGSPAFLPLQFHDEQFLDLTAETMQSLSNNAIAPAKAQVAQDLIDALRLRNLFVRGFAWEPSPRPVGLASRGGPKADPDTASEAQP